MYQILLALIWGLFSLSDSFAAMNSTKQISLSAGESLRLPVAAKNLRISEKPPFQVRPENGSLEIRGLRPGQGTLYINNEPQEIIVLSTEENQSWKSIRPQIQSMVGIHAKWENGHLILSGRLYSLKGWRKIQRLFQRHPMKWSNHFQVSEDLKNEIQRDFSKELKTKKENSHLIGFHRPWSLEINKTQFERENIKNVLRVWGIKPQVTESTLELKPVIRVNMAIAELKIETLQKIGIDWPTSFSAKIIDFSEIEFDDLVVAAHALESQGRGKVLAKPNILARSGSEAEFLAGGEFPIKIKNFASQDVVWKKYGVLLKILPVADHSGRISLKIDTEISQIDMARAVDGVPGLTTNRVSSHFDLAQSQSVALSGLLRLENHEKRQGLSFLQRIPLLGALFSSQDFIESKSELVIFVRPEIVRNLTEDL